MLVSFWEVGEKKSTEGANFVSGKWEGGEGGGC